MAKNDGPGLYDAVGRIMKMTLITRSVHVKRVGGYWGHSQCSFPHRLPASGSISTISHFFPPPYLYCNSFPALKHIFEQVQFSKILLFAAGSSRVHLFHRVGGGRGWERGVRAAGGLSQPFKGKTSRLSPSLSIVQVHFNWWSVKLCKIKGHSSAAI